MRLGNTYMPCRAFYLVDQSLSGRPTANESRGGRVCYLSVYIILGIVALVPGL